MITVETSARKASTSHTIQEFLSFASQLKDYTGYRDLAYIERRDGIEFTVKQVIDDYLYELKEMAEEVKFANRYVRKYRFNPKLLAYDLYNSTRLYYLILKLNDMCNVHEFSLRKPKLLLISPPAMNKALTYIYSSENKAINIFKNAHKNDIITVDNSKYVYIRDPIARFWNA